jgi:hypothetical protein
MVAESGSAGPGPSMIVLVVAAFLAVVAAALAALAAAGPKRRARLVAAVQPAIERLRKLTLRSA